MKLDKKFFNPTSGLIGVVTGFAIGLAVGNFWIGLGVGVVIAVLTGPMYEDEARSSKIKNLYWLTLAIAIPAFVIGAIAITLLAV